MYVSSALNLEVGVMYCTHCNGEVVVHWARNSV